MAMDIGEVRAATGMSAATLHHYEQLGLIESTGRVGLRRQYHDDIVERLAVVSLCQRSGFTLAEINGLVSGSRTNAWRTLVDDKIAELDDQVEKLRMARTGLEHARNCPSDDIMRCEHFRARLDEAFRPSA